MVGREKLYPDSGVIPTIDPNVFGDRSHGGSDSRKYLWAGYIVHVDVETMVCSVRLETGYGDRQDVPIPAFGGAGPRSFAGCIPERGSKVLLSWKRYGNRDEVPYIVSILPPGTFMARDYAPFSSVDPEEMKEALRLDPSLADMPHITLNTVRLRSRKAYDGDFLASSSSGSDLILDRDVYMTNRGGSEFRLRDSDQTMVIQTVNEFKASAAGYHRRGLIKRNAFNLLPDLYLSGEEEDSVVRDMDVEEFFSTKAAENEDGIVYVDDVLPGSPAFKKLREFGLVDDEGNVTIDNEENALEYPFVVMPDGQRSSYVVDFERDQDFATAGEAYVEDRLELFHTHDGILSVTDETDGIQIDHPLKRLIIEDVKGTVVGNDAYTDAGRRLYKKILTMGIHPSMDGWGDPDETPVFSAVDTVMSSGDAQSIALARLFRVAAPKSDNQYVFGITKDGRVFLHVPKSKTGMPDEIGRSVDMSIAGAVKALIGGNSERVSLDMKTKGGVKLDIGTFLDDTESVSVDVTYQGKVNVTYAGTQAVQTTYGGTKLDSTSGDDVSIARGNIVNVSSSSHAIQAESLRRDVGTGGIAYRSSGDSSETVLGRFTQQVALLKQTTLAIGETRTVLTGLDTDLMLSGQRTSFVTGGSYTVGTGIGNYSIGVATGNLSATIGTGNLALATGAGAVTLATGAGSTTVSSAVNTNVLAGVVATVGAPIVKIGASIVGTAVAGIPGPPAPHRDYITGLPLLGIPNVIIG